MSQDLQLHELQDDQEATDAAVSVGERVQGLELVVRQRRLHDGRHCVRWGVDPVDRRLEPRQLVAERSGDEAGVLDRGVLRSDEDLPVSKPASVAELARRAPYQGVLEARQETSRDMALLDPGEALLVAATT